MQSIPMQRVGPLVSVPAVLASFDVDADSLIERAGLSVEALSSADNIVPFGALGRLLNLCAEECDCPHFGLLLGARHDHMALGPVGALMATAPTLGDALLDFVSNQHRNSRGGAAYLLKSLGVYFFGFGIYDRRAVGNRHVYDLSMAVGVNMLRNLAGPGAAPIEILLSRLPPQDARPYFRILGSEVRFNQPQSALVLSEEQMALPVTNSNPADRLRMAKKVAELLDIGPLDFSARVRHLLKPKLLVRRASRANIADSLGITVRTLNRRLRMEGMTYRALEQEVRLAAACELLAMTDLQISEIASVLDYGSLSSFDRAFVRWTQMAPGDWRRMHPAA